LAEKYKDKGLQVLAVNTRSSETAEEVRKYAAQKGLKHVFLQGGSRVAAEYGVEATPTTFYIDKTGAILDAEVGFDARSLALTTAKLLES
jgi:hypothetical protein